MRLIEIIASGIGKVWRLLTSIIMIGFGCGVTFFGLMVFMPEDVLKAIDIIKTLIF